MSDFMAGLDIINLGNLGALAALEEAEQQAEVIKTFHNYDNPFVDLSDSIFKRTYRLRKDMVAELINTLRPHMVTHSRTSEWNSNLVKNLS